MQVMRRRSEKCNARTRKPQRTKDIESVACFFACVHCVFRFLIASQAIRPLLVLHMTTCKLHVGTAVYISLMNQWIRSQMQHSNE